MPTYHKKRLHTHGLLLSFILTLPLVATGSNLLLTSSSKPFPAQQADARGSSESDDSKVGPSDVDPAPSKTLSLCDAQTAIMVLGSSPTEAAAWFKSCPDAERLWFDAIKNANGCQVRYGAIWRLAELAPSDKLVGFIAALIKDGEDARQSTPALREMVFLARIDAIVTLGLINTPQSRELLAHMFTLPGEKEYTEKWIDLEMEGYEAHLTVPARDVFIAEFRGKVAEALVKTGHEECRKLVEDAYSGIVAQCGQINPWPSRKSPLSEAYLRSELLRRTKDALAYAMAWRDVIDILGREKAIREVPFPGSEIAQMVEEHRMKYR